MGLRFMVISKRWAYPNQPPPPPPLLLPKSQFISSSSSMYLLHTVRGTHVYVKFGLPLQHTVLDGGKLPHGVTLKAQSIEKISEDTAHSKELSNLEKIYKDLEKEIGELPTFTRWAEAAGLDQKTLQRRLQFGWYCRDKLLRSTRSLVMFIAKNYRGMGIAFDDLLQAGFVGVLNGAERYDIKKGYRFSTYVQYWIRKSILAMIACHSRTIQVPVRMENMIKKIQKARKTLYAREGMQPQDEEIAELTGLSLANIRLARKCSRGVGSIQKEIRDGWHTKFMEITADTSVRTPDEVIAKQHIRENILNLLQTLHPRERQVLVLRYGLEDGRCKSLEEIGRLCRVTKEWIRKIEKEALSKITNEEIQTYLSHYIY
ncbi:RNA polymerase sigma factor sigC [Canna indica]|uniref:RNA polymerase sigma factor sigC n=1 Tax=Canna indica TaxID=4628 RepID=A0AAQ3Q6L7_9LILI|nr:RNA polymerase sigma factor sigC [Canna indica]